MNNKKEVFAGLILIFVFLMIVGFCGRIENNYSIKATVKEKENGIVTFEDVAGYLWEVERPETEVHRGDEVKIRFFNGCTDETRVDDEIISFKVIKRSID